MLHPPDAAPAGQSARLCTGLSEASRKSLVRGQKRGQAMCKVKGCSRPDYSRGLCGQHALQSYYRTEVVPGAGLTAVRVARPPRILRNVVRASGSKLARP